MTNTKVSIFQSKILDWLRANHPDSWVAVGGVSLQVCRGLENKGLMEIRAKSRGWELRLTPKGRGEPQSNETDHENANEPK